MFRGLTTFGKVLTLLGPTLIGFAIAINAPFITKTIVGCIGIGIVYSMAYICGAREGAKLASAKIVAEIDNQLEQAKALIAQVKNAKDLADQSEKPRNEA